MDDGSWTHAVTGYHDSPMTAGQAFDYAEAFSRNIGLVTPGEQARLREATIGLPGMGAVGGAHLLTLARLGITRFVIADGDVFEMANLNRQAGATVHTLGQPKVRVMAEMARAINPTCQIRLIEDAIQPGTVDAFLEGCDLVIDGLDFFAIRARRLLFRRARARGVPVITCGPMGFSVAMLLFLPEGPSFDAFMALRDEMSEAEQLLHFAVGLAPAGLHVPYIDPRSVSLQAHRGPSSVIAVNLCAALAAGEALNWLLKRRPPWSVPRYLQCDAYRLAFRRGRLPLGNRHPIQQLKLRYLRRAIEAGRAA